MTSEAIFVTILASLLSGLTGVLISFKFYDRLEKRKLRIETAKKLIGGRFNPASNEFNIAMNEIFLVYADCPEVMTAMTNFWEILQAPVGQRSEQVVNDKLQTLLKTVCRNSGIIHSKDINDDFFLRTFNGNGNPVSAKQGV
ncbi:DUF6680 family protein [Pseudoalteromonas sp. S1608]|uniref:DUF6680 family protein n=1 Tax=Pseudoalteromonas sp. S1608 TaxID=579504 RepID=UPI00110B7292|nr:DUF6680 family protein [Pseudoalteromonas sp. S1608]TMP73503.1 hypothetical protein CWB75_14085 [Pseudoalteromonas sp. S1608]